MKPCILSSSSGPTDLVLVSEKFLKTPWGRGSFCVTALLSAPLSLGISDNKTAPLRIIWRWIEHEFLATPLLHRKVEGFFISPLCCVFLANNSKGKMRKKVLKGLCCSAVQIQPFNKCYNTSFQNVVYFKYRKDEKTHSGFSLSTDLGQAWLLNWAKNILSYPVLAEEW